jgi:hypothetical protein
MKEDPTTREFLQVLGHLDPAPLEYGDRHARAARKSGNYERATRSPRGCRRPDGDCFGLWSYFDELANEVMPRPARCNGCPDSSNRHHFAYEMQDTWQNKSSRFSTAS